MERALDRSTRTDRSRPARSEDPSPDRRGVSRRCPKDSTSTPSSADHRAEAQMMIEDGKAGLGVGREPRVRRRCSSKAYPIRLSGEDVVRGTFSHGTRPGGTWRAASRCTTRRSTPGRGQAAFSAYDSPLSRVRGPGLRLRLLPVRPRTCWCSGRPSSATSPTARR